jgi:hypothetical protein
VTVALPPPMRTTWPATPVVTPSKTGADALQLPGRRPKRQGGGGRRRRQRETGIDTAARLRPILPQPPPPYFARWESTGEPCDNEDG